MLYQFLNKSDNTVNTFFEELLVLSESQSSFSCQGLMICPMIKSIQKYSIESAAPLILVRTERESTACFGQTSAVDAQVSASAIVRLEDKAVHTKYKQFEVQSHLSDQWT
ncbi:Hypothetical_protein [Hexamita inflata]|uniref:Hypothetical_protein n=1 Tax=Hexamita inflata TaxID=28002 RepID=A0AA86PEP2_9EUKA|nr:Hypothetical protein HINF_LOCUS25399 [Hexamita inflata]